MKTDRQGAFAWATLGLTLLFEGLAVLFRFGLDLQSTRDTASTVGVWTGGLRIHHGYVGLLVVVIALLAHRRKIKSAWFVAALGVALVLSDLIHHFLVLWPLTGDPQFDLTY